MFAKSMAYALKKPFTGIDHIKAHIYAAHLEHEIQYPHIGVIVSGGHTIISLVKNFDDMEILGTTIDDACGEAFDKVAKYYNFGFPGGAVIDRLAEKGNPEAFNFPMASLDKHAHLYDLSYSGLKTAVINQSEQFWNRKYDKTPENIAASFQYAALTMLLKKVKLAVKNTGVNTVVLGGGVASNSMLRKELEADNTLKVYFPSKIPCTDNAAMIAGLGYRYFASGMHSEFSLTAESRLPLLKKSRTE
jgi:N6-L-threonylcarbamoyladenine synthase